MRNSLKDRRTFEKGNKFLGFINGFHLYLVIIIVSIFFVHALSIREGVGWVGGDYIIYLWSAENILAGLPMDQQSYLPNFHMDSWSRTVPPLYPIFLVPAVFFFGNDFDALRVWNLVPLMVFVTLFAYWVRQRSDDRTGLIAAILIGCAPYMFGYKNAIMSEFLFLSLLMAVFLFSDRVAQASDRRQLSGTIGFGLLLLALFETRVIAIVLAPALILVDWVHGHLITRATLAALATWAVGAILIFTLVGGYGDYLKIFLSNAAIQAEGTNEFYGGGTAVTEDSEFSLGTYLAEIPQRIIDAPGRLTVLWSAGTKGIGWLTPLSFIILAMAGVGFIYRCRTRPSLAEAFCLGYGAMLMIVPAPMAATRMYLPLMVMVVGYAFIGIICLFRLRPGLTKFRPLGLAVLTGVFAISMAVSYGNQSLRAYERGPFAPPALDLFVFLDSSLADDAALIGHHARSLAYFTRRVATPSHMPFESPGFPEFAESVGATHAVLFDDEPMVKSLAKARDLNRPEAFEQIINGITKRAENRLDEVFRNEAAVVFALTPAKH